MADKFPRFALPADSAIGIAALDDEHAAIIVLLNDAHDAAAASHNSSLTLFPLFVELRKHFSEHFTHEERVMTEMGYPDAEAHKEHHQTLLDPLAAICERIKSGHFVESTEIETFFASLIDDILRVDHSFKTWIG